MCLCNVANETTNHYQLHCLLFTEQEKKLHENFRNLDYNIQATVMMILH